MYGEVLAPADGYVTVDFLKGQVTNGVVSSCLASAIARYRDGLADPCSKHRASPDAFTELTPHVFRSTTRCERFGPRAAQP